MLIYLGEKSQIILEDQILDQTREFCQRCWSVWWLWSPVDFFLTSDSSRIITLFPTGFPIPWFDQLVFLLPTLFVGKVALIDMKSYTCNDPQERTTVSEELISFSCPLDFLHGKKKLVYSYLTSMDRPSIKMRICIMLDFRNIYTQNVKNNPVEIYYIFWHFFFRLPYYVCIYLANNIESFLIRNEQHCCWANTYERNVRNFFHSR